MSEKTKAAVKSLREDIRNQREEGEGPVALVHMSDLELLLEDHPADDDEPVTEEWLRSVSHKQAHLGGMHLFYWQTVLLELKVWNSSQDDLWRSAVESWATVGEINLRTIRTRGDVRRLWAALGVELKEVAAEGVA